MNIILESMSAVVWVLPDEGRYVLYILLIERNVEKWNVQKY